MSNKNGSRWIRPEKRLAIYIRDGMACAYCGRGIEEGDKSPVLTLDHLKPRSAGGNNDACNLITACQRCNSRRQDTPLKEWAGQLAPRLRRQARRKLDLDEAKRIMARRN
jgi:5-methylcytosine-specific restriction endonuclease McrA